MAKDVETQVLNLLEQGPATPDEVASKLKIAWATAHGLLLKLSGTGKVRASRKGRVNVYFLKEPRRATPTIPPWVRAKSLEELSEELQAYFPKYLSAAEMIERERRKA